MLKHFLIPLLLLCFFFGNTQNQTLFTIDGDPVYSKDFIRVYKKNLELVKDENQKDVDNYLELFIKYKLKVKEARTLGLDKNRRYVSELQSYRKQLVKNYLTDANASDQLIKEAYDRLIYDVNATHILIFLNEDASPKDTLAAYNKLSKLRKRLKKEDFDKLRKELHDGENVFVEDLNYFSAFDMVYPFETMAYTTKIGQVSKPFRTRFGFHILKVNNKRQSMGERTIAHILILDKESSRLGTPEERINEVYNKIQQGESFEVLARRFSEDKGSSRKGGLVGRFKKGKLSAIEFENVAFSLQNKNDISKPFKTKFGWHIVKLIDKHPVMSYDAMKPQLTDRVLKDSRSKLIGKALYDDLKKRYTYKLTDGAMTFLEASFNDTYFTKRWKAPSGAKVKEVMSTFADQQITYEEFFQYASKNQETILPKPMKQLVEDLVEEYIRKELYAYHDANLENEYDEFAGIMQEYREGILLFNLMESKVWQKAKADSLALKKYYDANQDNYKWDYRITGVIASVNTKKEADLVRSLMDKDEALESIKKKVNKDNKTNVIFTLGEFEKGSQNLPQAYNFDQGLSKVYKDQEYFIIIRADEIKKPSVKDYNEIKGKVINDYQNHLEELWLAELTKKYKVEINQQELSRVKKQIK